MRRGCLCAGSSTPTLTSSRATGGFFPGGLPGSAHDIPRAPGSPERDASRMGAVVNDAEVRPVSFSRDGKPVTN